MLVYSLFGSIRFAFGFAWCEWAHSPEEKAAVKAKKIKE